MDPFDPPGTEWIAISPTLARLRRTWLLVDVAVSVVAVVVVALVLDLAAWWLAVVAALVVVGVVGWVVIGRSARSWAYAERDDELYIRHGAMFRTLVVVPYGRMQYVDVQAGPLEQLLTMASLHLHTASPGTSARIPGLPAAEASRLRDRLTSFGESQAAGL